MLLQRIYHVHSIGKQQISSTAYHLDVLLLVIIVIVDGSGTATVNGTVAPGDEEPLCEQLRALGGLPIPAYSPNMRVLMDTWNYQNLLPDRTGAVWDQVDNDDNNPTGVTTNWIQNSNAICQQTVHVCGFSAGSQDNWLITQLINRTVDGIRLSQVSVLIELELQGCGTTLNCQQTFNTHIYETSSVNAAAARHLYKYRQVRRVSPDFIDGSRVNTTITINFNTNHSSFYFSIEDETSCLVIIRMIVFYYVCPQQIFDLINHPETLAPPFNAIVVTANCVENSEPENGKISRLICSTGGIWSLIPDAGCRCVAGHYFCNETCESCPAGTYLSPSNNSCSMCPVNSVSEEEGLTQCTCIEGYYRAAQGGEDLPCTRYAGTMRSTTMESINSETSAVETLTAITSVISSLVLILLVAFTVTLVLLVHVRCHRNCYKSQRTPIVQAPEATYSTVGPPLPPVRIERNMSYEERAIHTDNHRTAGHDTNSINTLQSQLGLNESAETDAIPTRNSTINMLLPQGIETLPTEHVSITGNVTEREAHIQVHETNVAVPQALVYGIQTEENDIAYNGQFEIQNLGLSNEDATTTQMVINSAYGPDVSIAPEVQTQANLAYEPSHARMTS